MGTHFTSASTFQKWISWNKLWKFLEFHKISWNLKKGSSLLYQLYMMLPIPDFFFYSRNCYFVSWKIPKIPENSWISGEVEALHFTERKWVLWRGAMNTNQSDGGGGVFHKNAPISHKLLKGEWLILVITRSFPCESHLEVSAEETWGLQRLAPIDAEHLPVEPAGVVAAQVAGQVGQLLRLPDPPDRRRVQQVMVELPCGVQSIKGTLGWWMGVRWGREVGRWLKNSIQYVFKFKFNPLNIKINEIYLHHPHFGIYMREIDWHHWHFQSFQIWILSREYQNHWNLHLHYSVSFWYEFAGNWLTPLTL